jgi:hypothetical protein
MSSPQYVCVTIGMTPQPLPTPPPPPLGIQMVHEAALARKRAAAPSTKRH